MSVIEVLESIRDGKLTPEKEQSVTKELLRQATENATNMSKFVLKNPQYFSEDGVKKAKKYLEELGKE